MKIINPTDLKVEVVIEGQEYSIEPQGSLEGVSAVVATNWKTHTHNFLILEEEVGEAVQEDSEEVEEVVEEEEETEEEEKEELDLEKLSRNELDAIAIDLELNPEDYRTKKDVADAILEATDGN